MAKTIPTVSATPPATVPATVAVAKI